MSASPLVPAVDSTIRTRQGGESRELQQVACVRLEWEEFAAARPTLREEDLDLTSRGTETGKRPDPTASSQRARTDSDPLRLEPLPLQSEKLPENERGGLPGKVPGSSAEMGISPFFSPVENQRQGLGVRPELWCLYTPASVVTARTVVRVVGTNRTATVVSPNDQVKLS